MQKQTTLTMKKTAPDSRPIGDANPGKILIGNAIPTVTGHDALAGIVRIGC